VTDIVIQLIKASIEMCSTTATCTDLQSGDHFESYDSQFANFFHCYKEQIIWRKLAL